MSDTIAIKYDAEGRIRNHYLGDKSGDWLNVEIAKWPGNENSRRGEHPGGPLAYRFFYRPETPDDAPPDKYNDEPGPNGWHPMSTETIGVVFEMVDENEDPDRN